MGEARIRQIRVALQVILCVLLSTGSPLWAEHADIPQLTVEDLTNTYSLAGEWQFMPGDQTRWASPDFDDSGWGHKYLVERWTRGGYPDSHQMAWYRLTLKISEHGQDAWLNLPPQGVKIGKILSAYELYAGGKRIGGQGALPPLGEINHDRMQVYPLPRSAVSDDGTLVLALRVWGGSELAVSRWGGGPYLGEFCLGDYATLLRNSFLTEIPGLTIAALLVGFGLYHIYLYRRNRQLETYLWYGLMALDIGIYGAMLNQWRYQLGWSFVTYEKIEFGAIYLFPALAIQMVWPLINLPIGRVLRAYQLSFVAFALTVVLVPGFDIHYYSMMPWELWSIFLVIGMPWVVIQQTRKGNTEARTVLAGVLLFTAVCVHDLMIDMAGWDTIRLVPLGFIAILLSMAVSLANRFAGTLNYLEDEVAERTSELLVANEQLAEAAKRDLLTGLLNRRGFTELAQAEVQRFLRTGRAFSIVLGDVDRFKTVNDKHGHACGDYLLQHLSEVLRKRVREMDEVSRWGGEEFIIILPETSADGAVLLAENIRAGVEHGDFEYKGRKLDITMTFGVASFQRNETLDNCIARADKALYTGKERGRNRVMMGSIKGLSLISKSP